MRADIHDGPEQMLQSKAGYIDARPLTASSAKPLATHGRTIHWGQKRRLDHLPGASGLPRTTDIARPARLVRWCQSRAAKGSGLVSAEYGRYPSRRVKTRGSSSDVE